MRRPAIKGHLGTARWSFEPPILLTIPFALLAIASLWVDTPFVPSRWVGSICLFALCIGSIAAGVRRTVTPAAGDYCSFTEHCSGAENTMRAREIAVIQTSHLGQPLVLSGTCNEGQLRIAMTFAGIAVAAISVVAFLVAGQLQRAGPISFFGIILSVLLVGSPSAIALHLAVKRVSVQFTQQHVRVVYRKGVFRQDCSEWRTSDIESVHLMGSECDSLVHLVIEGRSRRTSVPLWDLGFERARATLNRAGC